VLNLLVIVFGTSNARGEIYSVLDGWLGEAGDGRGMRPEDQLRGCMEGFVFRTSIVQIMHASMDSER
jgi:hypothetical protein